MSSNLEKCNSTIDCDLNNVIKFCFETAGFSEETFFCDCTTWFGWTGDNCDQETTRLLIQRYSIIFLLIISSILLCLSGRAILLNFLMKAKFDALFSCLLYSFFALVSFTANVCLRLKPVTDPNFFIHQKSKSLFLFEDEVVFVGVKVLDLPAILLVISNILLTISLVCLIISWNNLNINVSRFDSISTVNCAKKSKNNLILFLFFYSILIIFLISFGYVYDTVFIITIVSFIIFLSYIWNCYRLLKTFKKLKVFKILAIKLTSQLIVKVCYITCICLVLIILCTIGYALSVNRIEERLDKNEVNYAVIFLDLTAFFSLIVIGTIVWYCNSVSEGAILADTCPGLCLIFRWFDYKNLKLMPKEGLSNNEGYLELKVVVKDGEKEENIGVENESESPIFRLKTESSQQIVSNI